MYFWQSESKPLLWLLLGFLICFYLPVELIENSQRLKNAFFEALYLVRWYAQEHVLLCLIPALFLAGAIAVFITPSSEMKTAIAFSIIIGLLMDFIFRKEELAKISAPGAFTEPEVTRPLWQNALFFGIMVGILVFANWAQPTTMVGLWAAIYSFKWWLTGALALMLAVILVLWFKLNVGKVILVSSVTIVLAFQFGQESMIPFTAAIIGLSWLTSTDKNEAGKWFSSTWDFAKQILPLLLFGVIIAGALLGRPDHEALIPSAWVSAAVGGNSLLANFLAALAGAFMYFATLTEVPIVQGLVSNGMGQGPALSLLLAGPSLSLPNMLVIHSILGTQKTAVFVSLVVLLATFVGTIYGAMM